MMKKIILTITPNPALDLSGIVKNLKPNEKTYVFSEQRAPGGNAINCARILSRLQIPVVATGFLGGSVGQEVEHLLKKENLRPRFIKVQGSTRINVTVSNSFDHQQTRLSFQGPMIKKSEKQQLFDFVKKQNHLAMLILGGSLPSGFMVEDVLRLMRLAKKKNIECIVDCPGNILSKLLAGDPTLIKPNLEEFQALTKSRVKTIAEVLKKAQSLLTEVPYICVSSVQGGALLITREGSYFGKIPDIKIRSSVGAGDAMVGAMAAQIFQGNRSPEQILKWGLAAAAATLGELGTSLGQAKNIIHLYKKIHVEAVS
ncbi:1-phosphofructokinase family hexose kinase [Bdellovibrio sp.]|uniref:1-phosphofructokinase family hexose kinase n=1 Tax=Bdellovibrio sp. TaxID=28201 RepID=UPI0039E344B5